MTKKSHKSSHQVFKRIPAIKDRQAIIELGRAHLIIALLAFALFLMLVMSMQPNYMADPTLSIAASVLLVIVGLFSLAVAVRLYTSKK